MTWFILWRWAGESTFYPFSVALPTGKDGHLHQSFYINSPESYSLNVVCRPVGPLEGKNSSDFLNTYKVEKVPCKISAVISGEGGVVAEDTVQSLTPASWSFKGGLGYKLLSLKFSKSGKYELDIHNQSDLSYLDPTEPKLKIEMSIAAIESRLIVYRLVTYSCLGLGFLGLITLISGLGIAVWKWLSLMMKKGRAPT